MKSVSISYPLSLPIAVLACLPVLVLFWLAEAPQVIFQTRNLALLANTIMLTGLTALGAVAIGVPLALVTAYIRLPLGKLWLVLLAAPLALPSYIGAFTLFAAFGPGGEIQSLTGLTTPAFSGLIGSSIVMALYTYPFVLMTTRSALLNLDVNQLNAARTLGLGVWGCLWRVVLPRIRNSIAAGALLCALYAVSDFGTPAILGLDTLTRVIYVEYNAFALGQAALLSLQLLFIVGLVIALESRVAAIPERPGRSLSVSPAPWKARLIPLTFIPVIGFALVLPLSVFSLWLWREGAAGFKWEYAFNSVQASLLAALAAAVLALPLAHAALVGRFGRVMERVTYLGFGIPGIVMGTALVYLGLQLAFLYQTLALLVIAYVMRFLPLAVGSARTALESLEGSLPKAARTLGAGPLEVFRRVSLPLTRRGLIAGMALVFLESMRELPATLLLAPTGFETLATYLWRVYEAGYFGRAAIPGLLLILLSILGLGLMLMGEKRADFAVLDNAQRR